MAPAAWARLNKSPSPGAATTVRQPRNLHSRQQIKQATLGAADIAELIKQRTLHIAEDRAAIPSSQK